MTSLPTFRIATVRGVAVRMSPAWLLVVLGIVWTYQRTLATEGRSVTTTLVMAGCVALLFTASVLVHELAHALEGSHRGIEVDGITLFLLGGATALQDADRHAADEFAIAAIGPWSNIVLAAVFGLLATAELGGPGVADVAGTLGWLNLGLAAFNLVPGAPLDGGRVLRAAVWAATGDRNRATVVAAWVGIALGLGLAALAVWLLLRPSGGLGAAVWIGLVGAFVLRAARVELARGRLARWLAGFVVADLAPPTDDEVEAGPDGTLPRLAHDDPGDRLVGLLDRDQPRVVVDGPEGAWVSTLQRIDRRISDLRGEGTRP